MEGRGGEQKVIRMLTKIKSYPKGVWLLSVWAGSGGAMEENLQFGVLPV